MKKSTQKSLVGFGLTVAGAIVGMAIWSFFDGEEKVEEVKAKTKAA